VQVGVLTSWWANLSIDLIEAEVCRPTIFKDENKLTSTYLPDHLFFREELMKTLTGYFKGLILYPGNFNQNVIIMGSIGTGKTALTKRFGLNFEKIAKKYGVSLKYAHVNCRKKQSNFLALLSIIHGLDPNFPSRGYSFEELLEILFGLLETKKISLLLCLDEVDFLVSKNGPDILYSLTRISDDKIERKGNISLILVVRDVAFRRFLDASIISSLHSNTIYLEKYTVPQLREILEIRATAAFHRGTVSNDSLNVIAEMVGSCGDARYAIELLWRAGKHADLQNSKLILPEHVRYASAAVHPFVQRDLLEDLSLHHLFLLLGVTRELSRKDTSYLLMKQVGENYTLVCEEYYNHPRKNTQMWQYIRDLCNWGILSAKVTSQGIRGRTTFISLPDIPAKILEKELESILTNKPPDYVGGH